ncbi:MAG: DUF4368 domain-containing protein [Ruminococcus sp.]|nr:DUF4368 domain-containing protein [Ruminococcus sp.]
MMYCSDCGSKLKKCTTYHTSKKHGRYAVVSYSCNYYANHGKSVCTSHHIMRELIESLVLADIRARVKLVVEDEDTARQMYLQQKNSLYEKQSADNMKLLITAENHIKELDTIISRTYEERMLGRLPEELSTKMLEKYLAEHKELVTQVDEIKNRKQQFNKETHDVEMFIQRLKKYVDVQELTLEMCLELIEYIVVYERPEKYGAPRKIDIYYKFIDNHLVDGRNLYLPQNNVKINK